MTSNTFEKPAMYLKQIDVSWFLSDNVRQVYQIRLMTQPEKTKQNKNKQTSKQKTKKQIKTKNKNRNKKTQCKFSPKICAMHILF